MKSIDWDRLRAVVSEHVDAGAVPGAVIGVQCGEDVRIESLGSASMGAAVPLTGDAVFRISSMTKPLTAALTMTLVEDGTLALDAPIERWVPELADRRVVQRLGGPIEDTVPANRPITVDDLLTLRMGFGFVFDSPCPVFDRAMQAGLGIGPPDPTLPLTVDEWVARFAELPLMHQPGADWMYEFGFNVLGVVLTRAGREPLDDLLRDRILAPLDMRDTGFQVPAQARPRLIPCYAQGEHGLELFDGTSDSRWIQRPAFPQAGGGLVSTAANYLAFARMLLNGGLHNGTRLLSEQSVAAMTTDHLGSQRPDSASAQIFLSEGAGWGLGLEIIPGDRPAATRYGWGGGLGTTWYSFPDSDTAAALFTQCFTPPEALVTAFWSSLAAMIS